MLHTSSHTLSFSLSLSEVRVHPDYSSISCALFLNHSPSHEFKILSETDIVENPGIGGFVTFREESRVEWFLDWEQSIRVELRTFETGLENRSPILVAYTEFRLTQTLVAGKEFYTSLRGVNGDECGVLHFNTREIDENRLTLLFKCSTLLSADTATKKDLLSKLLHKEEVRENRNPHLYLELAVKSQTGVMQTLVTSEEREFAERIDWDMIHIPNIKDINLDKPVWIRLWDRDSAMKLSQTCDKLRSLLTDCEHDSKKIKLDSIQSEKRTQPSQLSSSVLISDCRLVKLPTCVDYLLGGHGLGLTIAVDFTVSNGDHILPTSYHNMSPANDNMYMECIKSALHFIKQYSTLVDSGTPVVAYGFGAVPAHLQQMSFCFALNQQEHNPLIQDGLLAHYANAVRTATASGPTSLSHVVHRCLNDVMAQESYRQYRVCSVLVAGGVRDLRQVRELIAESARYPVSFVIIGIGNQAGLSELEKCFREDVKLTSANGARAVRSNVVYRHWKTVKSATQQRGQAVYSSFIFTLTSKIMQQFREYYHLMNITPPTPVNNKTSPEMPYRSLAKQTSLYGQFAAADVSDIKAFQESQLLATPSPHGPVKKESSIGASLQDAPPSLDASLIKPITLSYARADPPGTPLTPEETLLQYNTFATPLSGGRDGRYSPLIHPSTPLIHAPYYDKKPSFHIED